uniref:DNA-(apurinic or apyrimidinic site) endonuclease n=1 Tax=Piliocolobus tephrosceles TaxID=591936 RepID=A0A8C9GZE2_9PRIM
MKFKNTINILLLHNRVNYLNKIKKNRLQAYFFETYKSKVNMMEDIELKRKRQSDNKNINMVTEHDGLEEKTKKMKLNLSNNEGSLNTNNITNHTLANNNNNNTNDNDIGRNNQTNDGGTKLVSINGENKNNHKTDQRENITNNVNDEAMIKQSDVSVKAESNKNDVSNQVVTVLKVDIGKDTYEGIQKKVKEESSEVKQKNNEKIKVEHYDDVQKDSCNNKVETISNDVKIIVTWNVNSITVRCKNKQKWKEFLNFFYNINADVLCIQEVRLPAKVVSSNGKNKHDDTHDRSKIKNSDKKSLADYEVMTKLLETDFKDYNAYFSLANIKYSGQLLLVKKGINVKSVRYNLQFDTDANIHNDEGRIILIELDSFYILSTYSPNNGFTKDKFERRRLFDKQLEDFFFLLKQQKKKIIWTGDLNLAPEDIDLSHPAELRRMKKGNVPKEFIGIPGSTDFERRNFQKILKAGDLIDSYRYLNNKQKGIYNNSNKFEKADINDNIYTWRCPFQLGKSSNKGMRIDHFIVSSELIDYVYDVKIHGYSVHHKNFFGSDHCPVILCLKRNV